jgi:hypothetical protein
VTVNTHIFFFALDIATNDWKTSSTTKTGRHDIAEILLKVALTTINQLINQLEDSSCHVLQKVFGFDA